MTAWRGRGDTCAKFLQKGKKVFVSGEPRAHAWISRDNEARGEIEMNADEVEFLSSAGSGRADPSDEDAPPAPRDEQTGMEVVDTDEQPF